MPSLEKQIKSYYQSIQKPARYGKKSGDTRISKQVKRYFWNQLFSMESHKETEAIIDHLPIRKQDRNWARNGEEKTATFAVHLSKIFKPNPRDVTLKKEKKLFSDTISATVDTSTRPFIVNKVKAVIKYLNPKKSPSSDLITNQILQKLSEMNKICHLII